MLSIIIASSHTYRYLYDGNKPNAASMIGSSRYDIPANWPQPPVKNKPGDVPGPPVQYGPAINPDDVEPGYGYSQPIPLREDDCYYYHTDHLGSTGYITASEGNATQFVCYMPFGEAFVDEHTTRPSMPYKFNGKEQDEQTGLYYYGARYYDSKISVFYGVDPLDERYVYQGSFVYAANNPIKFIDVWGMGPGDRVKAARSMTGIAYKQETTSSLRTANTTEAKQFMDCAEFVCRVMSSDQITDGVKHMAGSGLKAFLDKK